ncbi:hypothetical protein AAC387_Pa01g3720 [Persea americana]
MALVRNSKNLPGATAPGIHNMGPPLDGSDHLDMLHIFPDLVDLVVLGTVRITSMMYVHGGAYLLTVPMTAAYDFNTVSIAKRYNHAIQSIRSLKIQHEGGR